MRNTRALSYDRCLCSAVLIAASGCSVISSLPAGAEKAGPDLKAIVAVLDRAYDDEGADRPVIFINTDETCDEVPTACVPPEEASEELKNELASTTGKTVLSQSEACYDDISLPALTPVQCETREIGVSISLGRFIREEDGETWHVPVTIARSGLDSTIVDYVLEHDEVGWTMIEPSHTLEDDMGLDGLGDFGETIALLESSIGDIAAIYSICENVPQDRPASRCWTMASQLNPELRNQICDRMLDYVEHPYEEECQWGVVWPLEH